MSATDTIPQRLYFDDWTLDAGLAITAGSAIEHMVTWRSRDSQTWVESTTSWPVESWSSGEKALWRLLQSVQSGELYDLASRFRDTPHAPKIAAALSHLFGVSEGVAS